MRVPNGVHEAQPWLMGQIAPDFTLLDVWALPVEGRADEIEDALGLLADFDPAASPSALSRFLFAVRFRLGEFFGWDEVKERPIPGCSETSLRARLPARLRDSAPAMSGSLKDAAGGFQPLYRTDKEWAAEISNATVHGVAQLTWVEQRAGRYRAHLAVYVKPRGRRGQLYLTFIDPFRHLIVYPALMRQIGQAWDSRSVPQGHS